MNLPSMGMGVLQFKTTQDQVHNQNHKGSMRTQVQKETKTLTKKIKLDEG